MVLDNDTDVDNDTLTLSAVLIDDPTMGTVAVNADGTTIDFTPAADVNGPVSVTYTTADGNGGTDQGTLSIMVTPVADAPEPVGDHFEVDKNSGTAPLDVLANDIDVDGDTLSLVSATTNQGGTVSVTDGQLAYQPAEGFNGLETITYTVTDGERDSTQTAEVMVNVPYRLFGVAAPDFGALSDEFVSLTGLTALSMGSTHALVRADFSVSGGGSDARHLVLDLRSGNYEGSVESVLGEGSFPESVSVSSVSVHWPDTGASPWWRRTST